jgi:ASC-1-like (ASCH) protein
VVHQMGLYKDYFKAVKVGKKTVEVRLNDEKRRKISVGDTIEFVNVTDQNDTIKVQVTELRKYDTFEEMYLDIPVQDFDCQGWTLEEMLKGTYEIYTKEQEKQWGTLAITVNVIPDLI